MNILKLKLIKWLKKSLDRIYYNSYTLERGPLIREMFPWIYNVWAYAHFETFIRNNDVSQIAIIIEVVTSYYRGEVDSLIAVWKIEEIKNLKWLLDFASYLRDYKDRVMYEWQE